MKGYIRDPRRRKTVLDVDLNVMPPGENNAEEVTTTSRGVVHGGQVSGLDGVSAPVIGRLHNTPIDVEAIDDEVLISSPRRFTEARNQSRRNQVVTLVLDEDLDVHQNCSGSVVEEPITRLTLNSFNNLGRNSANEAVINYEHINLESNHSAKRKKVVMPSQEPPQNTVAKELIFSCAICMGPLAEAASTTCGHIFCMKCIKAAIAAQKKCPTCRHKLSANNIHRVYLPTTN